MNRLFSKIDDGSGPLTINIDGSTPSLNENGISLKLNSIEETSTKKSTSKKGSKKNTSISGVVTDTVSGKSQSDERDDMLTTNRPYHTKYQETTNLLKASIVQLDGLLMDNMNDTNYVRSSKTLRSKYNILPMLSKNSAELINSKITAIREINNTISKCNDLELRRMKELALSNSNENSDKKIMDMYNAFVSMPVGNGPNLQNISNAMTMGNVVTGTVYGDPSDAGYQDYLNNMNPAQRLNMYESNPNVKQVVVYNQQDGSRYFEVMDVSTGEVINGVDKHDSMFLEGVTLDLENKIARNVDLGETYPIVVVGEPISNMY